MESNYPVCAECGIPKQERACVKPGGRGPGNCPSLHSENLIEKSLSKLSEESTKEFARQASIQEAECYARERDSLRTLKCRIEEVIEFSNKMNYKKLGLAFCNGLIEEAAILAKIFRRHGFNVVSAACKAGCVGKEWLGLDENDKIHPGKFESMCNPVAQAEILNEAGTEFNLVLGLCVGHDSLLLKNSKAYATVIAVKDRLTGHNPLAALYLSGSYYKRLLKE